MKTDLSKQTKYYKKTFNQNTQKFELTEIPLNRNNWWYVQLDGTIRYAFLKNKCPLPKYVILEELPNHTHINVFRSPIKNEKELLEWNEKYFYVYSELKFQGDCNSTEEYEDVQQMKYEFKLL